MPNIAKVFDSGEKIEMVFTLGLTVSVCGWREGLGLNGCLMSGLGSLRSPTL